MSCVAYVHVLSGNSSRLVWWLKVQQTSTT